jgi:histidinol dehydrogenase
MRTVKNNRDLERFIRLLRKRAAGFTAEAEKSVRAILYDVKIKGDSAIKKYTRFYDRHNLPLKIDEQDILKYAKNADSNIIKALKKSAIRIKEFHERQKEASWSFTKNGAVLGQLIRPLQRIGVYVPGGKASYPSTVLMNVIPAQVAGVEEIAVCVPSPLGEVNPSVMAALKMLGIKEVYRIGGAQAIGALAYGTKTIKKVDKIVGPGNIYVATAKKMVFGDVDIDMIAGPSEITIVADHTANPAIVAADMLGQAEHDEMASSILITNSDELIIKVSEQLKSQIKSLKRKEIAQKSLRAFGAIIKTDTIAQTLNIANEIAPEHLEIITEHPSKDVKMVKNAGAVFLGQWTPESLGDYSAGPNHTLPTCGTARFSSPLGVYDFIKKTSLLQFDKKSFIEIADIVETLAGAEGLEAHANTISIRKKQMYS